MRPAPAEISTALHARVRRFIDASMRGEPSEAFDDIARAIAAHQYRSVAPVRRLFDRGERGEGLGEVDRLEVDAIPAVPTDAFRHRRIAAHAPSEDERVFLTSGTTTGLEQRGRHAMRETRTYAAGALAWGRHMLFPDTEQLKVIALVASEEHAPESSLTFMVARFAEALGGDAGYFWDGERLDVEGLGDATSQLTKPALVAGTSFAFVHLLDALGSERRPLPEGSRVMQTGGFKGRTRSVQADELRCAIAELFALPEAMVVAEYGMTELSSQLYQPTLRHRVCGDVSSETTPTSPRGYRAPPWLRVRAVDPVTLAPVAQGEVGLARFVDLANVDSAIAIQTADRIREQEDRSIELLGRAPGATPRGCSLALEHLLTGASE